MLNAPKERMMRKYVQQWTHHDTECKKAPDIIRGRFAIIEVAYKTTKAQRLTYPENEILIQEICCNIIIHEPKSIY